MIASALALLLAALAPDVPSGPAAAAADAINRAGFAAFRQKVAGPGRTAEITESPFLRWYLDCCADKSPRDAGSRDLLAMQRVAGLQIEPASEAKIVMTEDDVLDGPNGIWNTRNAFTYHAGDVRGVRIDDIKRARSLYVFYGSHEGLDAMRLSFTSESWASVRQQFHGAYTAFGDFALVSIAFWPSSDLGKQSMSCVSYWPVAPAQETTIDANESSLRFRLTGYRKFGPLPCGSIDMRYTTESVDTLKPQLYVVEDRNSGLILLMGFHP
jgi:hypothetical protein